MNKNIDQLVARARLAARDARNNLKDVPAWLHDGDKEAVLLALELADTELTYARHLVVEALDFVREWPEKVGEKKK